MIQIKRNKLEPVQMPVERAQTAVEGLDAHSVVKYSPSAEPALKREIRPFTGIDAKRDYRAMYRAAFEYHDRHNPPQVIREYWQQHKPGEADPPQAELDYWAAAAQDACEVSNRFDNDKFVTGLLGAIYDELGREYASRQAAAQASRA